MFLYAGASNSLGLASGNTFSLMDERLPRKWLPATLCPCRIGPAILGTGRSPLFRVGAGGVCPIVCFGCWPFMHPSSNPTLLPGSFGSCCRGRLACLAHQIPCQVFVEGTSGGQPRPLADHPQECSLPARVDRCHPAQIDHNPAAPCLLSRAPCRFEF